MSKLMKPRLEKMASEKRTQRGSTSIPSMNALITSRKLTKSRRKEWLDEINIRVLAL